MAANIRTINNSFINNKRIWLYWMSDEDHSIHTREKFACGLFRSGILDHTPTGWVVLFRCMCSTYATGCRGPGLRTRPRLTQLFRRIRVRAACNSWLRGCEYVVEGENKAPLEKWSRGSFRKTALRIYRFVRPIGCRYEVRTPGPVGATSSAFSFSFGSADFAEASLAAAAAFAASLAAAEREPRPESRLNCRIL